eukprot:scaffold652450_cov65-Prasinocladus_malaysianus.AAC.1
MRYCRPDYEYGTRSDSREPLRVLVRVPYVQQFLKAALSVLNNMDDGLRHSNTYSLLSLLMLAKTLHRSRS